VQAVPSRTTFKLTVQGCNGLQGSSVASGFVGMRADGLGWGLRAGCSGAEGVHRCAMNVEDLDPDAEDVVLADEQCLRSVHPTHSGLHTALLCRTQPQQWICQVPLHVLVLCWTGLRRNDGACSAGSRRSSRC
jgi:hypothetical protein